MGKEITDENIGYILHFFRAEPHVKWELHAELAVSCAEVIHILIQ